MNNFLKKEWIDLVFDGKNKSYGAYELRAKSGNIMLKALFIGIMLVASLISIPVIANHFGEPVIAENPEVITCLFDEPTIVLIDPVVPEKQKIEQPKLKKIELSAETQKKFVETTITQNQTTENDLASKDDFEGFKTGNEEFEGNPEGSLTTSSPSDKENDGDEDGTKTGTDNGEGTVFEEFRLDKKAEFPGGIQSFIRVVQRNYRVPDIQASKYTVYVSFVVEIDGSISDIKVIRDPGNGLGQEAIRTLKNIKTKWEPGIYQGNPVRMLYYLPIKINVR